VYSEEHRGECLDFVGIISRDEIRVNWFEMDEDYAPRYLRYRGRHLESETVVGQLRLATMDFGMGSSLA
jgi:hypothetical protein